MLIYLACAMLIFLLIGALLAQRCKVLALVPAIGFTAVFVLLLGDHDGAGSWQLVGAAVPDIICLQVGYLAGAGLNFLLVAAPAGSTHHRTLDGSASRGHTAN